MAPTTSKKSATLARVRDNQRRCRARKREYVVELEQKIRDLEAAGPQANTENYQNTIQRLEAENRTLRVLLNQAGFSQSQVEAQLQEGHDVGDGEGTLKHIERQGPLYTVDNVNEYTEPASHEAPTGLLPDIYGVETFDDLLNISLELQEEELFNFGLSGSALGTSALGTPVASRIFDGTETFPYVSLLSASQAACHPGASVSAASTPVVSQIPNETVALPCASLLSDNLAAYTENASSLVTGDLGHLNLAETDGATTLCSVAYDLVRQHNKKGVDMMEICIRLWNGLVKGTEGEGCKVENKLLFSVLEYIRG